MQTIVLPLLVTMINLSITYAVLFYIFDASVNVWLVFLAFAPIILVIAPIIFSLIHTTRLSLVKKRIINLIIGCLVTLPIILWAMMDSEQYIINTIPLKNSSTCYIYADSFIDIARGLYYEIRQGERVIVPLSHFDADGGNEKYKFQAVYADHDTIIGILQISRTPTPLEQPELIAIYHTQSGESWPRLRDDEVFHDPAVFNKWNALYAKLKNEHPTIPIPYDFSGEYQPSRDYKKCN